MSKINRIIWYDNVDVDEELLSDTIQGVKESNEIEDRQQYCLLLVSCQQ